MIRITRHIELFFILGLLGIIIVSNTACKDSAEPILEATVKLDPNHPNILLIIADDLGIESTPCYNTNSIRPDMPTLESLCSSGLVFDNVWSNPFCAPTRASMITGKHGVRTGVLNIPTDNTLDLGETTIQRYISNELPNVYSQALIGKWHLSNEVNDDSYPEKMGIPYFDGLIEGHVSNYSNWKRVTNGVVGNSEKYATTVFTNSAINWIDQQENKPWFLWLSHIAPHKPFHLPPRSLHNRDELPGSILDITANPLPYYHAMLEAMDHEIERLLKSIPSNVRENTIIIFISDNGTMSEAIQTPYTTNQAKGSLFQGGVHVPMIVQGAGVDRIGERENALVNTTDIFATVANLAGIEVDKVNDSKSFVPLLSNPSSSSRNFNYTDLITGWTYRSGDYKLIYRFGGSIKQLYNITLDPYENTDLSNTTDPEIQNVMAELESRGLELRGE